MLNKLLLFRVTGLLYGRIILLAMAFCVSSAQAETVTLFDGSNSPIDHGMYYQETIPGAYVPPASVNTTGNNSIQAGFYNHDTALGGTSPQKAGYGLNLDRHDADGFTVRFSVEILESSAFSPDRFGFSVTVLSNDHYGIELGFGNGNIASQDMMFQAPLPLGNFAPLTTNMIEYALTIQGDNFVLSDSRGFVDGGALVDYSQNSTVQTAGDNPLDGYHVYNQTNFIFLGDNTQSEASSVTLGAIRVENVSPVPEPATMVLLASGGMALLRRKHHN